MELTAAFLTTEDRRLTTALLESKQADVAQLVEQPIRNRQVSGSSPLVGSSFFRARSFSRILHSELGKLSVEIPFSATLHLPTGSNLSDNMARVQ